MKEILITSSVMILAVIVLRFLFRKQVSRRVIYGAWLLVALRLLVPIQFGQLDFSVLTQAEPVTEVITEIAQKPISGPSREELYNDALREQISQGSPVFIPEIQEQVDAQIQQSSRPAPEVYDDFLEINKSEQILLPEISQQIEEAVAEKAAPSLGQIALWVWLGGIFLMACWFIGVNAALHHSLRLSAFDFSAESPIPVKVSLILSSPCLFGFFRPVIYLTPACTQDEQHLRHVLTHEQTHLRHCDHIWAWVRCLCLCIYWFNPLVWVAAYLSKRDCELACDEAALKILGEEERLAYGRTLVDMVASNPAPGQLLETATAMHETKKQLKERVNRIVKKPKLFLTAAIALLLVLTIVTGCAFTGPVSRSIGTPDSTTPTTVPNDPTTLPTDPTTVPTAPTNTPTAPPEPTVDPAITEAQALLSSGWFNQALTSTYSEPEYLDLYEFFYNGFAEESKKPTDEEWELLKNIPGFTKGYNLIRLPASKMNEVLLRYFDRTLESNCIGLDKFTYLESTNCYYHMTLKSNAVSGIKVTKVEEHYNETFIYYTKDGSDKQFRVTLLDYLGNGYTVTANQTIMDNDSLTWFAGFPEPDNYHRLFTSEYRSNPRLLMDVFLHDPDAFVKYIALEKKGWNGPAHSVSLVMRNFDGTEEWEQYVAACKRIAEDPTSTPDEQYAAFQMIWDKLTQEEERAYRLQALAKRTPLDDYTVDTCLITVDPSGGNVPQFNTNAWIYTSSDEFPNFVSSSQSKEDTATSESGLKSYAQIVSSYDADFFEENVLVRIDVRGNKNVVPVVSKVTVGEESYWTSSFSVYLECDETNWDGWTVHVLFIAIPKEHYQPYIVDHHEIDFIINGEPRLTC